MKNIIGFLLVAIVAGNLLGQITYKQNIVSRIDFREKQNISARTIPSIILQAFCEGRIKAYFPKSPNTPMKYEDFLAHFGISSSVVTQNDNNISICLAPSCSNLDPTLLSCFSIYMDIDEQIQMDSRHSQMKKKITYIRLIYSADCNSKGLDYEGPIFKISHLKKLNYTIKNPQNSAADFTLSSYFQLRLFNAIEIKEGEEYHVNPAKKDAEKKEKYIDMENNMWEN